MKKVLTILMIGMMLLAGCGNKQNASDKNPVAKIEMENGGVIEIELLAEYAPNTVANFIMLANSGFYDGVVFHRIVPGFMIQGGDPTGTGMGGPEHSIKGEFEANGFGDNTLSHERGVISMARAMDMDSAGSQFFIVVGDSPFLDNNYAAFGRVISGMEVADEIVNGPKMPSNPELAAEPAVMKTVTVDTFGVEWPEPEMIK